MSHHRLHPIVLSQLAPVCEVTYFANHSDWSRVATVMCDDTATSILHDVVHMLKIKEEEAFMWVVLLFCNELARNKHGRRNEFWNKCWRRQRARYIKIYQKCIMNYIPERHQRSCAWIACNHGRLWPLIVSRENCMLPSNFFLTAILSPKPISFS